MTAGIIVFSLCDVKLIEEKTIKISCFNEHKVLLCVGLQLVVSPTYTQTPVLLLHLDQSLLVATHRYHTEPHYIDRL